jgi:hypothetical protein
MAKKVDSYLVDDFDGSKPAQTVKFGLHGTEYEIDLSEPNTKQLESDLERYIGAGRRVGRGGRTGRRSEQRHAHIQAARVWLRAHGHDIGDRGRVPKELMVMFEEAQLPGR